LSSVRVWSPTPEHQDAFINEQQSTTSARSTAPGRQEARDADLVVLATSASGPVVQQEWIKAGAHVMSVGACRPDQREIDPALVIRARLFVDSRAAALAESGDLVLGLREQLFTASQIAGELGEVIAKSVEGRRSPREVTLFKSLGPAFADVAAADYVYRRALAQDTGIELEL
jgi:ornithine cyclodeaminase